jgi:hypothetical protein
MYIVPIAWIYVALMMSVAEATNSNGTVLGAIVTFVLYGLMPVGILLYIMGTPGRKRLLREREAEERQAYAARIAEAAISASVSEPDAGGHATTDPVTPVRKEA